MNVRQQYRDLAYSLAQESGLPDPDAFVRQIQAESNFNPFADSGKALGIGQFTKATGARYGLLTDEDRLNPEKSLRASVSYMRDLVNMFGGDQVLASAAYNAGENAVKEHGGIPPYKETQNYVNKIWGPGAVNVASSEQVSGKALRYLSAQDWAKANGLEVPADSLPEKEQITPPSYLSEDDWARANGEITNLNAGSTESDLINAPAPVPQNAPTAPSNIGNFEGTPMEGPIEKETTISVGGPQTDNPALEQLATGQPIPPKREMSTIEKVPYWADETLAGLLDLPAIGAKFLYEKAADLVAGKNLGTQTSEPWTPFTSNLHKLWGASTGVTPEMLAPSGFGEEASKLATGMALPLGQYKGIDAIAKISKTSAAKEIGKQLLMAGAGGLTGAGAGRLTENTNPAVQTVATAVGAMLPAATGGLAHGLYRSVADRVLTKSNAEKQALATLLSSTKPGESFLDNIPVAGGKTTRSLTQEQFNNAIQQFQRDHEAIKFTLPEIVQSPAFSRILNTQLPAEGVPQFTPASFNTMAAQYHWLMQHPKGESAAKLVGEQATKIQEANREAVAQGLSAKPFGELEKTSSGLTTSGQATAVLNEGAVTRLNSIVDKLRQRLDNVGQNQLEGDIGEAQRLAFKKAEDASRQSRNALFDEYKKLSKQPIILDTANIRQKVADVAEEYFPTPAEFEAKKGALLPDTVALYNKLKAYSAPQRVNPATGQPIAPSLLADEAIAIEKQANDILYNKNASLADRGIAGNIKAGIRGDLLNENNPNIPEAFRTTYQAAVQAANKHHQVFDTALRSKMLGTRFAHEFDVSAEKLPGEVLSSRKNVEAYVKAVGQEQATKDLGNAYATELMEKGVFSADGSKVNATKLEEYLKKTKNIVQAMPPELQEKIATLAGTGEKLSEHLRLIGEPAIKKLFSENPLAFVQGTVIKQMFTGGVSKLDIEKIAKASGVSLQDTKKLIRDAFAHQIAKPFEDGDLLSKRELLNGLRRNKEAFDFILGGSERGTAILKELKQLTQAQRRLQAFDTKNQTGLGIGSQTATRQARGFTKTEGFFKPGVVEGAMFGMGFMVGGVPGIAIAATARLLRQLGPALENEVEKHVVESLFDPAVYTKLTSNSKGAQKILVDQVKKKLEPSLVRSAAKATARNLGVVRAQEVSEESRAPQ